MVQLKQLMPLVYQIVLLYYLMVEIHIIQVLHGMLTIAVMTKTVKLNKIS